MHEFLPYAWFEGKCIPFKEAKISIATHALHYGTAAFGGMRAIPNPSNKEEFLLFRTDKHIKRLSQSAKLLLTDISEEYIFKALEEVIKINRPRNPIYIRPFVYTSDLGIAPRLSLIHI